MVDPFTQVKSTKHMVISKTKFISNRGAFSHFSKSRSSAPPQFTERWFNNFLKINWWNWSGSHLFCYWAWSQKKSGKLQNTLACTEKTGLSSMKFVQLIQIAGWAADKRSLKMSAGRFLFPELSRKDWSDSASRVP